VKWWEREKEREREREPLHLQETIVLKACYDYKSPAKA
jgi:hypothetical protein